MTQRLQLIDAGSLLYLVRPGRPVLPLPATAPGELFVEGLPVAVRIRFDGAVRAASLALLPDGVTETPPAIAVPRAVTALHADVERPASDPVRSADARSARARAGRADRPRRSRAATGSRRHWPARAGPAP